MLIVLIVLFVIFVVESFFFELCITIRAASGFAPSSSIRRCLSGSSSSSSSSSSVTGDRAWESESGFGGGNASHVRKCIRAAAMAFGYDDEAALVADRRFMSIAEARRR